MGDFLAKGSLSFCRSCGFLKRGLIFFGSDSDLFPMIEVVSVVVKIFPGGGGIHV